MKQGIHPNYQVVKVICQCGNVFETRSTAKEIKVEICSMCHPFFTGKQKLIDSAGRVDRYRRRYAEPAAAAGGAKK
jgi:large subunit ribosomal protein L31